MYNKFRGIDMKKINILKIRAEKIALFNEGVFEVDFTNQMQVTNIDKDHPFYNVFSSVYLPKYLAFNGVNSAGKTTVIEIIGFFIEFFLNCVSLDDQKVHKILDKFYIEQDIKFTMFFEYRGLVYKVITDITKDYNDNARFNIIKEQVYTKKYNSLTTKKSLFDEGYYPMDDIEKQTSLASNFMFKKHSILMVLTGFGGALGNSVYQGDMGVDIDKGNQYLSTYFQSLQIDLIKYLDPSIKNITPQLTFSDSAFRPKANKSYSVEMESGEEFEMSDVQIYSILSSGTRRALMMFKDIRKVLRLGGYFVVDELELSLNRSVVNDIIRLFESHSTNPNHATLIFSTHYIEILDTFERNDQIFVIHRNEKYKIVTTNYSSLEKKNVLKKSESFFADTFNLGTAIEYNKYQEMRKSFVLDDKYE